MTAIIELILAIVCVLAALLQIVTSRHSSIRHRPLARAGKRVMAAGFLFLALRLSWLAFQDVHVIGILWGLIALALIAWGSIMTNCERVIGE